MPGRCLFDVNETRLDRRALSPSFARVSGNGTHQGGSRHGTSNKGDTNLRTATSIFEHLKVLHMKHSLLYVFVIYYVQRNPLAVVF